MYKSFLATAILAVSTTIAFAQTNPADNSLSGKEMRDSATTMGGNDTMPKKPDESSISGKEMKDGATTKGGSTDMPNAKPKDGSLVGKEMEDHPGAQK